MSNMWEDDENETFRDIPDEVTEGKQSPAVVMQAAPRPQAQRAAPPQPEPEVIYAEDPEVDLFPEGEDDEDEETYNTTVLSDARLRLEQGRLYEMIMNHNLFEGMDADPQAIKNVQKEVRRFARERMEVMLGMRSTVSANPSLSSGRDNPVFNDLEIEVLKRFASKATNGVSETEQANTLAAAINAPRKGLAPIGGTTAPRRPQPAPAPVAKKPTQKLQSKTQVPLKRTRNSDTIDQIAAEEGVPRELLEENYVALKKPIENMTDDEKIERNRQAAARRAKHQSVKNPHALPMATPEQAEMLAMTHAAAIQSGPGMSAIIAKLKTLPVNNP